MVGTIAHVRPKLGHEAAILALAEEWQRTIRPTVPGLVVNLFGQSVDRPSEVVGVVLLQDETAYRALAARPEQDAWYRRLVEHREGEPAWQDITWATVRADAKHPSAPGS